MTTSPSECCKECYVADDMCRQYLCACHLKSESPAPLQEIKDPTGWEKEFDEVFNRFDVIGSAIFNWRATKEAIKADIRSLIRGVAEKARGEALEEVRSWFGEDYDPTSYGWIVQRLEALRSLKDSREGRDSR